MGITSFRTTEYSVICDQCEKKEVCHSYFENVHSKQQAIKWAKMHKTINGILCDDCFKKNKLIK